MTEINEAQIHAIKSLPCRYLVQAVLRVVETNDIIEAIDYAFEEWLHDVESQL